MSMLARRQLRLAALAALGTLSVPITSPGDWDTPASSLPQIKLRCGSERKSSVTRTMPEFTTTVTLELLAGVEAGTDSEAQDALELLGAQIEDVLLGNIAFVNLCQQFSSVSTQTEISSDGRRHIGRIHLQIDCELFESYDPFEIAPGTLPALTEVNVHLDMISPFDPTGTYPDPAFPDQVVPAPRMPRTHGPDGRDEATLQVILPS